MLKHLFCCDKSLACTTIFSKNVKLVILNFTITNRSQK
jgi:hypothetical protein